MHYDLNPDNILVNLDEHKLLDFGLKNKGSKHYTAPDDIIEHKSDIWSLGATIYETCALEKSKEILPLSFSANLNSLVSAMLNNDM